MVAQRLKHLPAMRETRVWSLGWEDPLEKEMETQSSILIWRIPWREEPGRLQSTGSQRVGHDWATSLYLNFRFLFELLNFSLSTSRRLPPQKPLKEVIHVLFSVCTLKAHGVVGRSNIGCSAVFKMSAIKTGFSQVKRAQYFSIGLSIWTFNWTFDWTFD